MLAATLCAAGCGASKTPARHAPDLAAFLRLPVATPSVCGGKVSGSTAGRRSPWVGTVDVSVFLEPSATSQQVRALGDRLRSLPKVRSVYFESADQAYAEFQRLYTCSADVPRSAVPASYRLVLRAVKRPQRDALVADVRGWPAVKSVSCDPSSPCLGQ
jgi:cell division protein FtsX